MSCLYTNADCLINKMPELKLHVKNCKPKIIGITEVKPKHFRYNLQNCELAIENYEMFSSNIINNVGRGVSLLYVIQLSDRVYNVTLPASDLYSLRRSRREYRA